MSRGSRSHPTSHMKLSDNWEFSKSSASRLLKNPISSWFFFVSGCCLCFCFHLRSSLSLCCCSRYAVVGLSLAYCRLPWGGFRRRWRAVCAVASGCKLPPRTGAAPAGLRRPRAPPSVQSTCAPRPAASPPGKPALNVAARCAPSARSNLPGTAASGHPALSMHSASCTDCIRLHNPMQRYLT